MKKIILTLIALTIFIACALLGYQLAFVTSIDKDLPPLNAVGLAPTKTVDPNQSCVLIIHVDRLDVQRPRMISAWAALLYFPPDANPKISLLPVYTLGMQSKDARALEQAFTLKDGVPDNAFWKAFRAYRIEYCTDFVMLDEYAVVQVLNWAESRPDMANVIQQASGDQDKMRAILLHTCGQITGLASRPPLPKFDFYALYPQHLRMNLLYPTAASYWDKVVDAPPQESCQ